jgi:hypothetical protein
VKKSVAPRKLAGSGDGFVAIIGRELQVAIPAGVFRRRSGRLLYREQKRPPA